MPELKRAPNQKELNKLREIFLKAETDIINEIGRLRSMGYVDYHAVAALERVQAILKKMETDSWEYVPAMIEKQFYARVPEALRITQPVEKHIQAYNNAAALTSTQYSVIEALTANLMGEIVEAENEVMRTLENTLLGRQKSDIFRDLTLQYTTQAVAEGKGATKTVNQIVNQLMQEGVTAFVDKAGRHWSLHTYCEMCTRTTSAQADVLAVLTADESQDLYQISSHGTTCAICAPLEGRVYSRSGKDPDFPPLALAYGKVDANGPDDLTNSYLNIHPSCLHVLTAWTPMGRSDEEIQKIKDFSSFKKNPVTIDPRTKKQIEAYRKKEVARRHWLETYRQWERYKEALGTKIPTFETFYRHKLDNDDIYKKYQQEYRRRNDEQ